jgi:hypothetical protein
MDFYFLTMFSRAEYRMEAPLRKAESSGLGQARELG